MRNLTTPQRIALRQLAGTVPGNVHGRTLASLKRRGYVDTQGALTDLGRRAHAYVMSSGNGPEGLKAMFRF